MSQLTAVPVAENGIEIVPLPIIDSRYAMQPDVSSSNLEFELLLAIANVELPVGGQRLLGELLTDALNWDYLLAMAALHGLEPLLFHYLRSIPFGTVPDRVLQILRSNCKVIALRNLLLSAKLREVSAHLTSLKIEHIAYKGPLLAEFYGNNGALRIYRDLDLLVPQEQLVAVRDALHEIGFTDRYGLTEVRQAASFRLGFEHPFSSEAGIDIDVHWRLVQEFKSRALDMDGVWARKTVNQLLGQDVPALSTEDLLVVLCLHAGHHGWMQLSHMCDLAQLFRVHMELDWAIVRGHLGDSNTRRIVCISLYLLQKHWQIEMPKEIVTLISADVHVERLAHRIEIEIWPAESPMLTTDSLRWLLARSAGEDWHDRLRLVAGSIFVPSVEDFALFQLSPTLPYLYSGLRLLRLAGKSLSSQWRRWSQGYEVKHTTFLNGLHGN